MPCPPIPPSTMPVNPRPAGAEGILLHKSINHPPLKFRSFLCPKQVPLMSSKCTLHSLSLPNQVESYLECNCFRWGCQRNHVVSKCRDTIISRNSQPTTNPITQSLRSNKPPFSSTQCASTPPCTSVISLLARFRQHCGSR